MVHPNETAINYIWEKFQQVWIQENTTSILKEVDSIQKGLSHKPFNPNSEQHQNFIASLQQKIIQLKKNYNITF